MQELCLDERGIVMTVNVPIPHDLGKQKGGPGLPGPTEVCRKARLLVPSLLDLVALPGAPYTSSRFKLLYRTHPSTGYGYSTGLRLQGTGHFKVVGHCMVQ